MAALATPTAGKLATMTDKGSPHYAIGSVDKALQIVLLFQADSERWFRVSEIADELEVARSTAHRLLAMLVFRGFARQDDSKAYGAGPALLGPKSSADRSDLREVARPALEALSATFDETTHLVVLDGSDVVFLDSVEGRQALKVGSRAGARMAAHLTSGGKALLATLGRPALEQLVGAGTASVDLTELERTLVTVRQRGYALNLGETERGIHAIGAVITDGVSAVGAISLSIPALRLPPRRVAELVPHVRQTAAAVSRSIT